VTAAGSRSFILSYYIHGHEKRYTIGSVGDWTTTAARNEAKRIKGQVRVNGYDPLAELQVKRAEPTVADLIQRYVDEHLPRKRARSAKEDTYNLKHLAPLARTKVADVNFADIDALHRKITKAGTPVAANRVHALASKMFSLAIKWQWRSDNPCRGVAKNPENKRERYLSADELSRLHAALAAFTKQSSANAIRFLILTGARRGEAFAAKWSDIDLTAGTWTKPASTTKQKKTHVVPLSGPARLLLADMQRNATGEFLFPGRVDGHQADIGGAWDVIRKAAKIDGVRLHDLRHTYASVLASGGTSLHVIGSLLGHSEPRTTMRYAHLSDDALRSATERAGAEITGAPSAEVLPMKRKSR
jgi:integrase